MSQQIIDTIHEQGIEAFGRFYGIYYAVVKDNTDPDGEGKIWISCRQLFGNNDMLETPVKPVFMNGGWVPEVNDDVLIMFECGDLGRPRYIGKNYTPTTKLPSELSTENVKGFKTRYGHIIQFIDNESPKGSHPDHKAMDKVS